MIPYSQALETIRQSAAPLPTERLPLTQALHRLLATTLRAPQAMPSFDQSLMDGYALRSADTRKATPEAPVCLPIGQTLTAGDILQGVVLPQQAIRIMTGAAMPRGVDTVVRLEDGVVENNRLMLRSPVRRGAHVQRRGSEMRRRTVIARAGERLTPQRIGAALSSGIDTAEVVRRPRVALVAPGDELLPPGAPHQPGKKWCSNLYALALRVQEVGGVAVNLGIVPDTLNALTTCLAQGLEEDIVVVLGASGRGDHDYATRAMRDVGAETLLRGVATSPGRSVTVARSGDTLIFGLPGTPWAAFIGFEMFVWPALRLRLRQQPAWPPMLTAVLRREVQVRRGLTHFLPVQLQPGPTGWHAIPLATPVELARVETSPLGLAMVPPHRRCLSAGARVRVQVGGV